MDVSLRKQVREVKYLATENTWRYRPILRYFYLQYEKIKYWLYREDVYEELKEHPEFRGYTLEQCQQDLDTLVEWGNLVPVQDTSRAQTVEEFKNKKFRYQLSKYTVEIERLTLKLESLQVEGASLEASLFERIRDAVLKMKNLPGQDIKAAGLWWRDLNTDFKRLNQNYQDYMRSFHSLKAEEMMRTTEFIVYKDSLIEYLREFVRELQNNAPVIEVKLRGMPPELIDDVIGMVLKNEKSVPRLDGEVSGNLLEETVRGRWTSFAEWFLGSGGTDSEAARVLEITNEVIRKITRYASQLAESRTSAANRKEEYRKLCRMFLATDNIEDAHRLSALSFGVFATKHLKGEQQRITDSINSSIYDEPPIEVEIKPRVRFYRESAKRTPIEFKTDRKRKLREKYIKTLEQEDLILESHMDGNIINVAELPVIEPHVRVALLGWIARGCASPDRTAKTQKGRTFRLVYPEDGKRCVLKSMDGNLEMPAYTLVFENAGEE